MTAINGPLRGRRAAALAVALASLVLCAPAQAAFPGANGRIVFTWDRDDEFQLWTIDADGSGLGNLTSGGVEDSNAMWSPDGRRLAFARSRGDRDINVMDASRPAEVTNLTAGTADQNDEPAWSPDGTRIAFSRRTGGGAPDVYVLAPGAPGPAQRLTTDPGTDGQPAWSPDGTRIAFTSDRDGDDEIYTMRADGSDVQQLTTNGSSDDQPAWSPDGTRIAFTSFRDGNEEVYVMPARLGAAQTNLTSNPAADRFPAWSPDGTRIAFTSDRNDGSQLLKMNADGTGATPLLGSLFFIGYVDWGRGAAPTAAIGVSPATPATGQTVSFDGSASSDADGSIASYSWDLDGDGSFEAQGRTVARSYPVSGVANVRLRVVDSNGNAAETTTALTIADRAPLASFTSTPNPVFAGEPVAFDASASSDPDGQVVRYQWDLDGDGTFETDTGAVPRARRSYGRARRVPVRLRVTDNRGNTGEAADVRPLSVITHRLGADTRLTYLDTANGIELRSLTVVKLVAGTRVQIRCVLKRRNLCRRELRGARTRPRTRDRGRLQFAQLDGTRLRTGTHLVIRVTKPNFVGTYIAYRVRRASVRKRVACLPPGSRAPRRVCR
jgi:dipeptidyl aminopeptidase/acylaminoacyl peptidase